MNHSQIRAERFPKQQIARFLTDSTSGFIVTSYSNNVYNVYVAKTAQLAFTGTADEVAKFLEG